MEACRLVLATPNMESYMGHKGRPIYAALRNFHWFKHNFPDIGHNLSNVIKMELRMLVGKLGSGKFYQDWKNLDSLHRAECELRGVFASVWKRELDDLAAADSPVESPLPWRLTKDQHDEVYNPHLTMFCYLTPTSRPLLYLRSNDEQCRWYILTTQKCCPVAGKAFGPKGRRCTKCRKNI